jgi:hypothetical protein
VNKVSKTVTLTFVNTESSKITDISKLIFFINTQNATVQMLSKNRNLWEIILGENVFNVEAFNHCNICIEFLEFPRNNPTEWSKCGSQTKNILKPNVKKQNT